MLILRSLGLILVMTLTASAADVILYDGRQFTGEIVSPPNAEKVKLKMQIGSIVMHREFDVIEIKSVSTLKNKQQGKVDRILQRREKLGDKASANDIWTLALLLKKHKQDIRFRSFAREVIKKDPQHKAAREALGYVWYNEKWMTPRQKHVAQGHVLFEGKWVEPSKRLDIIHKREGKRLAKLEKEKAAKVVAAQKQIALETAILVKKEKEAEEKSSSSGGDTKSINRKPVIYLGPYTDTETKEDDSSPPRRSTNICPRTGRRF